MSDPILNGTNPAADRRLMDDVMSAPDPFDGGCPADNRPMVYDLPISIKAAKFDAAIETHSRLVNLVRKAYNEANDAVNKADDMLFTHTSGFDREAAYRSYIEACRYRDGVARAWDIILNAYSDTSARYIVVK
jgi:hypothetical protein